MSAEKIGIGSSILGALVVAVYGVGMACYTKSDAILLDGLFNLFSAVLSVGSLVISHFVNKSYTKNHPVGFYAYEAFMIFVKGLFILGLVVMALYSNFTVLLSGGREPNLEGMLWYAFPSLLVNILTLWVCYSAYKKSSTGLLFAEYESWKINAAITSVIAFSLLVVLQFRGTPLQFLERYIDQILVIVLCILTIADPIRLIGSSFKEIMLRSVNAEYQMEIENILKKDKEFSLYFSLEGVLVLKVGRGSFVSLDLICLNPDIYLKKYLTLKDKIESVIRKYYTNVDISINIWPK